MHIDLHTHTTASDGDQTPMSVINRAQKVGVKIIAITDHNTIDGFLTLLDQDIPEGITVIPGVELTVISEVDRRSKHHMVALFPEFAIGTQVNEVEIDNTIISLSLIQNKNYDSLLKYAKFLRTNQINRARQYVQNINDRFGLQIDFDKYCLMHGYSLDSYHETTMNSLTINKILVEQKESYATQNYDPSELMRGTQSQFKQVFMEQQIQIIKAMGGYTFMAHPRRWEYEETDLSAHITSAIRAGLTGIEKAHSLCEIEWDCLGSAGSDFHGDSVKPGIELGQYLRPLSYVEAWMLLQVLFGSSAVK